MKFLTGTKLVIGTGVILDLLIVWWIFWVYDVIPDKLETFIKNLF